LTNTHQYTSGQFYVRAAGNGVSAFRLNQGVSLVPRHTRGKMTYAHDDFIINWDIDGLRTYLTHGSLESFIADDQLKVMNLLELLADDHDE